ncbi:MAG: antibiotic biosynthesis monooxygenase [Actinomycetota bacterium]
MGELAMIIKSKAQAGQRDKLYRLYQEHLAPRASDNEAQEVVVWCADQQDEDTFYLFEVYRDMASFGANAQAPWFEAYMATAGPLLAGEPEVGMATPRWSKGLPG